MLFEVLRSDFAIPMCLGMSHRRLALSYFLTPTQPIDLLFEHLCLGLTIYLLASSSLRDLERERSRTHIPILLSVHVQPPTLTPKLRNQSTQRLRRQKTSPHGIPLLRRIAYVHLTNAKLFPTGIDNRLVDSDKHCYKLHSICKWGGMAGA